MAGPSQEESTSMVKTVKCLYQMTSQCFQMLALITFQSITQTFSSLHYIWLSMSLLGSDKVKHVHINSLFS
ncbi:hypothetical protein Sjap_010016 [Stephania japonica]|uniref:Uncharacterized protein n=1 Tax=Stephania japonica TaxID=461633 RepID=A0AAP0J8T6_9MAGN